MSEYTLGGNSSNIGTVLSLKANSRLIRDISQHSSNQACIEFTSSTTARISVGDEHYDLSFADVKTTDVYCENSVGDHLDFIGEMTGRLQVTNSKSGVTISDITVGTQNSVDPTVLAETAPKKREISMLESSTEIIKQTPHKDTKRARRASHPKPSRTGLMVELSSPTVKPPPPALANPFLVLQDIPIDACANDILSSLFSGLSVTAIYVCGTGGEDTLAITTEVPTVVDVYVEFSFVGGAELGLQRDGEELQYRIAATIDCADSSSSNNNSSSNKSSSSSNNNNNNTMSSSAKQTYQRKSCLPYIEPVDSGTALWVRHSGLRVSALPNKIESSSNTFGASTSIKKHIESALIIWNALQCQGRQKTNIAEVLIDPTERADHWQDVMAQMSLTPGHIDAYSKDDAFKVRIAKDSTYIFTNPVVEDILCTLGSSDVGARGHDGKIDNESDYCIPSTEEIFIPSEDKEQLQLYNVKEDAQRCQFEPLIKEAEAGVTSSIQMWSLLLCSNDHRVEYLYIKDWLQRKLVLYRALLKKAWALSVTYFMVE